MTTAENKEVIAMFVEDVINQGRLNRINDLVVDDFVVDDFVEPDPLPGQQ